METFCQEMFCMCAFLGIYSRCTVYPGRRKEAGSPGFTQYGSTCMHKTIKTSKQQVPGSTQYTYLTKTGALRRSMLTTLICRIKNLFRKTGMRPSSISSTGSILAGLTEIAPDGTNWIGHVVSTWSLRQDKLALSLTLMNR
jgi:hypothetical protein